MKRWRKGDLFKIDWDKLIANTKGTFGPQDKEQSIAYQRSRKEKYGDRIWEAVRVENARYRPVLIHESGDGKGWTGTLAEYAIPVKKGTK